MVLDVVDDVVLFLLFFTETVMNFLQLLTDKLSDR